MTSEHPTGWVDGDIDGVEIRPVARHSDDRGWLGETFRADELPAELRPVMSYVSVTRPGQVRGPHEHAAQTDLFGFVGPGTLELRLWDRRAGSVTRGRKLALVVGEENPVTVVVPPGVVHGYRNVRDTDAWVLNFPNRLYAGEGRKEPVDEIRHEDSADSGYHMS
jgi:dTDP-4-dehydrorhamnose 3,5-epimerase